VDSRARQEYMRHLRDFLREKMRSPDVSGEVIVRRHEIDEHAHAVGVNEQEAWQIFTGLRGQMWEGEYMPGTRSEERGYLGFRVMWVA
jgi:hypothetical protein